ncbi:MAG: hypothetical protein JNN22_15555 [Rhodospirillales bacterium]|nr:hypothetical protein [Rhodospirillales bacterium]
MADPCVTVRPIGPERIVAVFDTGRPGPDAAAIGPDTWLMIGGDADVAAGIDVSDSYAGFAVTGPSAADVFAQGIALDLDRAVAGFVARTRLGDVAVLLWRMPDGFVVRCERSYADWLAAWLARAVRLSAGGI